MVSLRAVVCSIVLSTAVFPVAAQSELTVELTTLAGIARSSGTGAGFSGVSLGELSYRSVDNRDVKAEVTLSADVAGNTTNLGISRAFIKSRLPWFRLTMGKTRLSWGEGFMFNAGDVLFDSVSTAVDLTAEELRTAGEWLGSAYVPLGRFSFIEGVALSPQNQDDKHISAGGRLVVRPGGLKIESGYLFSGKETEHRPYISLQGHFIADWHASASTSLETMDTVNDPGDNARISLGLSHLVRAGNSGRVNLRLEGLLSPAGDWVESDDKEYALYLYPEISVSPDERRSVFYRAVVSPIDISAVHMLGGSWNIYQGFKLLSYFGFCTGEEDDRFSWSATQETSSVPGYFISAGCSFVF